MTDTGAVRRALIDTGAVRRALIELHRVLLNAQRIQAERFGGRMSSSELLQAAADDLRFSWLKELSSVSRRSIRPTRTRTRPAPGRPSRGRARCWNPPDPDTAFGARYLGALQEDP